MDTVYIVTAKTRARNFGLVSWARLLLGKWGVWLVRLLNFGHHSYCLTALQEDSQLTILISLKLPFDLQLVFLTQSKKFVLYHFLTP